MRRMPKNAATQNELLRMLNCKSFEVQECESYSQIRPPISRCNDDRQTAEWLANAVAHKGCERPIDLGLNGALDIWKRSPRKTTLSYYGVHSDKKQKPEALEYNKVVSKCLLRVAVAKKQIPKQLRKPKPRSPKKFHGSNILDRELLMTMVSEMPNIQKMLSPSNVPFCIKARFHGDSEKTFPGQAEKYSQPNAASNQENYEKLFKQLLRCFD